MPASLGRAKPPNEQIDGAASEVSLLELPPPVLRSGRSPGFSVGRGRLISPEKIEIGSGSDGSAAAASKGQFTQQDVFIVVSLDGGPSGIFQIVTIF